MIEPPPYDWPEDLFEHIAVIAAEHPFTGDLINDAGSLGDKILAASEPYILARFEAQLSIRAPQPTPDIVK